MYGRINALQSFGTLDGPGIRYVVFMQGCPLKCVFCHNADSIDPNGGEKIQLKYLIEKINACRSYLTDGGVTVSGGEPTMQWEFVKELFKFCKSKNIHTAMDSNCHTSKKILDELLPVVDLFMVSIKQMDEKKHIELTGKSNKTILENISYLATKKPLRLRYVLIKGRTDSDRDIDRLIDFSKKLKNLELIELLPFNSLGRNKWKEDPKADLKCPGQEEINNIKKLIEKNKLKVLL